MRAREFDYLEWHTSQGFTDREVAQFSGVHLTTVQGWVNPQTGYRSRRAV